MRVQVDKLEVKSDPRGCVWEPVNETELPGQRNVHVVITEPGAIRGNHYHKLAMEIATVRGPALVRYRDHRGLEELTIANEEVYRFIFPPNVPHAFLNNGKPIEARKPKS